MRLYKKDKEKLCLITWKDYRSEMSVELSDFLRKGVEINQIAGWIVYFDKKTVIIATEKSKLWSGKDLTWLFRDKIVSIEFLKIIDKR